MKKSIIVILFCFCSIFSQNEVLTNAEIIEMTRAGLSKDVIVEKINSSVGNFDASAKALIELKKANVDDEVIKTILERSKAARETVIKESIQAQTLEEVTNYANQKIAFSPKEALQNARTVSIKKDSIYPSTPNLEKELFKLQGWKNFNLTITANQATADLYIQIGHAHLSFISRRYVYRIYDTKSGTVLASGETTSWGSLSGNLARNIVKSLESVRN